MSRLCLSIGLMLILLATACGCGSKYADRGTIDGEVKLDGKPIGQGSIVFTPLDGGKGVAVGGRIFQGRFHLSGENGPTIGWNCVAVRAPRKTGKMVPRGLGATGEMVEEEVDAVAPQFSSRSDLKVNVQPGVNSVSFEVGSH
jgi:hypothetical protein